LGVSQSASLRKPMVAHPADEPPPPPPPPGSLPPPVPCSTFWDQYEQVAPLAYGRTSFPTNNCGYSPAQLRGAYGVQSAVTHGDTGRGVTVAIIGAYASPTILADANAHAGLQGEPRFKPGQYRETRLGPFDLQSVCNPAAWNEEQSLDVEAIHGM